jgi:hypothetical protein
MTSIGPIEPDTLRARDPDAVVCLIHGTIPSLFGVRLFSRISWMGETSWCRKNLFPAGDGGIHYSPFYWSGRNSHKGRVEAGIHLAGHLAELRDLYPASQHICVALGHGGNVAVYAFRRLQQSSARVPDRLITLGTPFFWAAKRDLRAVEEQLLSISGCGAALWMLIWLLLKSRVVTAPQYSLPVAIAMISFGWAVFLLTVFYFTPDRLRSIAEKQHAALSTDLDPESRVLCVCARKEETGIYLKVLETANSLCCGAWQIRLCQMVIEVLAVINVFQVHLFFRHLLGSPLLVRKKLDAGSAYIAAFMLAVMGFVAIASAMGLVAVLIMTIGAALLRSGPWGFYENLLLHWVTKIKMRETPMIANAQAAKEGEKDKPKLHPSTPVTKVDWIYSAYSFQHANMCNDPRVCESIQEWLCTPGVPGPSSSLRRAPEPGKELLASANLSSGFAVVAGDVRILGQRISEASRELKSLI